MVSSLAAFATSTLHFAGRKGFLLFCIGCQVVSGQVLLTPLFKLLVDTSLYSTHLGLILVMSAFSIPLSVYLFHGFFSDLPRELYESATIDSCNSFQYLIHILLPLSKPIMSTVAIFQAMFAWNEFLFSMTFLKSEKLWTLQPLINNLFSGKRQSYDMQFAALSITVIPIVLLYFALQKYFIKGMTAGAVKGGAYETIEITGSCRVFLFASCCRLDGRIHHLLYDSERPDIFDGLVRAE